MNFTPNATTPGWEQVQDSGWLNLFNRWQNGPQRWRGEFKHHGKWIYLPQIYPYPITSSSISRIECVLAKAPFGHYRKEHRMMVINQKSPKREFNSKSQGLCRAYCSFPQPWLLFSPDFVAPSLSPWELWINYMVPVDQSIEGKAESGIKFLKI